MQKNRNREKIKLAGGLIAGIAAIVLFWTLMASAEKRFQQKEVSSDTGSWKEQEIENMISLDGTAYWYTDRVESYLFMGTDASGELAEAGGVQGDLADFLAVLVINNSQKCFGILQIDRDSMWDIPVLDSSGNQTGTFFEQLCTAHWYGSTEEQHSGNTVNAVSEFLGGLPIDGYYGINMKDISAVNHVLGGVPVTIKDDLTSLDPAMKPGAEITLQDDQVEKYLRARSSVGEGTNKERMGRQYQYMQSAYKIAFERLGEDGSFADDAYRELEGKVFSDQPRRTFSQIANKMRRYENRGILSFDGESSMGDTFGDGVEHAEFYADPASITEEIGKIITFDRTEADETGDAMADMGFGTAEEAQEVPEETE